MLFTLKAHRASGRRKIWLRRLRGVADANGDGTPDLLVGEPKRDIDEDLQDSGAVYLFSGADGSLLRTLLPPSQAGAEANGRFEKRSADAGDLNGDGVHDIIIGAPGNSRYSPNQRGIGCCHSDSHKPVERDITFLWFCGRRWQGP